VMLLQNELSPIACDTSLDPISCYYRRGKSQIFYGGFTLGIWDLGRVVVLASSSFLASDLAIIGCRIAGRVWLNFDHCSGIIIASSPSIAGSLQQTFSRYSVHPNSGSFQFNTMSSSSGKIHTGDYIRFMNNRASSGIIQDESWDDLSGWPTSHQVTRGEASDEQGTVEEKGSPRAWQQLMARPHESSVVTSPGNQACSALNELGNESLRRTTIHQ
ncbi:hypothetical protein HAX54_040990, partial [Datura stramonium]|nr:hypothetical protein [Datura stramonium]